MIDQIIFKHNVKIQSLNIFKKTPKGQALRKKYVLAELEKLEKQLTELYKSKEKNKQINNKLLNLINEHVNTYKNEAKPKLSDNASLGMGLL